MEKDKSRNYTRNQAERVKKKRSSYDNANSTSNRDVAIGLISHTPAVCSCWMCGNPRKYFKEVTIQEKKFKDVEAEFLDFE
jgi:hypothetical protein